MRWCRIRLVLLGLLLCVVHVVSGTCGQTFTDPASSALIADVVFEGKVRRISVTDPDQTFNATVNIKKSVLKGADHINNGKKVRKVIVASFKTGEADTEKCIGSIEKGRTYVFFLRDISDPKGLHFELSAMPIKKSLNVENQLKRILCKNCARQPTLSKLTGPESLPARTKATLTCAAEARPNPVFSWYKDGVLLPANRKGRVRIKSRKRQSTLQIKTSTQSDGGVYQCVAKNLIGEARKNFTMKVRQDDYQSLPLKDTPTETKIQMVTKQGHADLCDTQTFCLNGGTCMVIRGVVDDYCVCPEMWAGRRCELLDAISVRGDYHHEASVMHQRTLIIIGIVLAVLVFIIICIASYILAKNRRKQFENRKKRREAQRPQKKEPAVLVEKSNPITRINKEAKSRSENAPSNFAPEQLHQILLKDSSSPPTHESPSQKTTPNHLPQQRQLADVNIDHRGYYSDSSQRHAAYSVYENVAESNPSALICDIDYQDSKSTAATVHPESIEMHVLQKTKVQMNEDESKSNLDSDNLNGNHVSGNHPSHLRQQQQAPSPTHPPQLSETLPHSLDYTQIPCESLPSSFSSPLLSSQSLLLSQPFPNDASSRDENDTAAPPVLPESTNYFPSGSYNQFVRPSESRSEKDISRYLLLASENEKPDIYRSYTDSQGNNHLLNIPHSNTFPKLKTNGLALDVYSESDEDDEMEVLYEKQLHISEEDFGLLDETENSLFFGADPRTRQTSHEELVMGLLPTTSLPRPGMRKYQSEEGPAYSKFVYKNLVFLQSSARSRSLEDPLGAREDGHDPMKLNSTIAGSPDVETYDNVTSVPVQLHSSTYAYDPNDDSTPWDGEINRTDFSDLSMEEKKRLNLLQDVLPDQQPIPI